MSIGDSLLDFYDLENITNANKGYWPNSKKYYSITLNSKIEKYDNIKAIVLKNDKNFIITENKDNYLNIVYINW